MAPLPDNDILELSASLSQTDEETNVVTGEVALGNSSRKQHLPCTSSMSMAVSISSVSSFGHRTLIFLEAEPHSESATEPSIVDGVIRPGFLATPVDFDLFLNALAIAANFASFDMLPLCEDIGLMLPVGRLRWRAGWASKLLGASEVDVLRLGCSSTRELC